MMESNMLESIQETCKHVPLYPFSPSEGFCQWLDSISKSTKQSDNKESE